MRCLRSCKSLDESSHNDTGVLARLAQVTIRRWASCEIRRFHLHQRYQSVGENPHSVLGSEKAMLPVNQSSSKHVWSRSPYHWSDESADIRQPLPYSEVYRTWFTESLVGALLDVAASLDWYS